MNRIKIFAIVSIIYFCFPQTTYAWGKQGHRVIGELSNRLLKSKVRTKINNILGGAGIAMVADWSDFVKADSKYDKYYDWHFSNFDDNLSKDRFELLALEANSGKCISQVVNITNYLKTTDKKDTFLLKMLIHIVGDMFQPLHLGHEHDLGANKVEAKWFGNTTNLHRIWDESLIKYENLSYSEYASYLMNVYKPKSIRITHKNVGSEIINAAWQTYRLVPTIYRSAETTNKSYRYIYDFKEVWEKQLVDAAVLLASLLNYIY